MALKVKAKEREFKVGKYAGEFRYVMAPELYSALSQDKVIREAALRSGVSEGVMKACWDAAGEVIKAWLPEGHSIPIPGLGSARFGLSAKSVADVNDVKSSLIRTRRIVFTPAVELKQELRDTSVIITCYDRNGNEVKRVTSADDGTIEEPRTPQKLVRTMVATLEATLAVTPAAVTTTVAVVTMTPARTTKPRRRSSTEKGAGSECAVGPL